MTKYIKEEIDKETSIAEGATKSSATAYSQLLEEVVKTGITKPNTMDKNNSQNFLKFLKKIYRKYPKKNLHIIADNLTVHKQKDVMGWIESKQRISIHFTPTYSSWLNQVKIWFNILSRDALKGAVWQSKEQLAKQLIESVDTYNKERAKPFEWTYDGKNKNSSANSKSSH